MFDFNNHWPKSKYYDNSNKLVVGKTKDKTAGGVTIKEFVALKQKIIDSWLMILVSIK